jgi:hypothetical protein
MLDGRVNIHYCDAVNLVKLKDIKMLTERIVIEDRLVFQRRTIAYSYGKGKFRDVCSIAPAYFRCIDVRVASASITYIRQL